MIILRMRLRAIMNSENSLHLARLLQLASPALPIGAFSYSQGLEAAVESGLVHDRESALAWINDLLSYSLATTEAPVLLRLIGAWQAGDYAGAARWNELFLATRETAELRAETVQMGFSLARLLNELDGVVEDGLSCINRWPEISLPSAFALAVASWNLPQQPALSAYLWSWAENQIMAALKTVPLGQTDGQRMLLAIGERFTAVIEEAGSLDDDEIGAFMPRLAILSSLHETQYSRMFRS